MKNPSKLLSSLSLCAALAFAASAWAQQADAQKKDDKKDQSAEKRDEMPKIRVFIGEKEIPLDDFEKGRGMIMRMGDDVHPEQWMEMARDRAGDVMKRIEVFTDSPQIQQMMQRFGPGNPFMQQMMQRFGPEHPMMQQMMRQHDPEMEKLHDELMAAERASGELAGKIRDAKDDKQRAELNKQLDAALNKAFDAKQAVIVTQMMRMEKQLKEMHDTYDVRQKNKGDIIKRHLNEMTGHGDPLQW